MFNKKIILCLFSQLHKNSNKFSKLFNRWEFKYKMLFYHQMIINSKKYGKLEKTSLYMLKIKEKY
jgi:hypothetical protein